MGTQINAARTSRIPMPLVALVIISAAVGALVALAGAPPARGRVAVTARHGWGSRPGFDPEAATGLALSLALIVLAAGGLVLAVLALLVRDADARPRHRQARRGLGGDARTPFTHDVLEAFTDLGKPGVVAAMAVVLAIVETVRTRSRWVAPFLLIVVAGNGLITTTIKHLADRVRPTINPIAETLGPSFPSGTRRGRPRSSPRRRCCSRGGRSRRVRIALSGLAAGLAVAIASSAACCSGCTG